MCPHVCRDQLQRIKRGENGKSIKVWKSPIIYWEMGTIISHNNNLVSLQRFPYFNAFHTSRSRIFFNQSKHNTLYMCVRVCACLLASNVMNEISNLMLRPTQWFHEYLFIIVQGKKYQKSSHPQSQSINPTEIHCALLFVPFKRKKEVPQRMNKGEEEGGERGGVETESIMCQ